ncbi:hypothetical protein TEA_018176 [Camellia sinensis var. sinensis]|uniref:Uncharacterized protein n=1 Tax=Camellia sinensis var. sinensis TaxID=542762 RepID=A0A4S4D2A5_CAMSN|nr:hypothetical protein TEA_018176 [Camellia sinensis var. sinensis]
MGRYRSRSQSYDPRRSKRYQVSQRPTLPCPFWSPRSQHLPQRQVIGVDDVVLRVACICCNWDALSLMFWFFKAGTQCRDVWVEGWLGFHRAYQCHQNDWRSHLFNLRMRQFLFGMRIYMTMWRPNTHSHLMSI